MCWYVVIVVSEAGKYQPAPRFGHASAVVQTKLYVWAGWQRDFPEVHASPQKTLLTSSVEVFSLSKGEWQQLETFGSPPLGVSSPAHTHAHNGTRAVELLSLFDSSMSGYMGS